MPTSRSVIFTSLILALATAQGSPSIAQERPSGSALIKELDETLTANYAAEATDVGANLEARMVWRIRRDQLPREIMGNLSIFQGEERAKFKGDLTARGMKIDKENTDWLKSVVPPDFFHISREGKTVTSGAMLILAHSPDNDWKRELLPKLIPLAEQGEVPGTRLALIIDKLAYDDKKPQVYGTQIICTAGKLAPYVTIDVETLDARRKTMGLTKTAAEYNSSMEVGRAC